MTLLIIADDFTGALDTGVKMAEYGMRTKVTTDVGADLSGRDGTEILVIDAETRHLRAEEAGAVVKEIVKRAVRQKIPHLYKKTDSALRGTVGAELTALLEGSGEKMLPFLPALPELGRVTVGGVHYIGDLPVAESIFGRDPFEPVRHSRVAELIGEQSGAPVHEIGAEEQIPEGLSGICVFDSRSREELLRAGKSLCESGRLRISAGSAGFASVLPELLQMERRETVRPHPEAKLLVLCGSVNPITKEQLRQGEEAGFRRIRLRPEEKLDPDFWTREEGLRALERLRLRSAEEPWLMIDSNDAEGDRPAEALARGRGMTREELREGISRSMGEIFSALFTAPETGTMLVTGGDTLLGCMRRLGVTELEPVCELYPGVVLSGFAYRGIRRHIITKSGGFGQPSLLPDLKRDFLSGETERRGEEQEK